MSPRLRLGGDGVAPRELEFADLRAFAAAAQLAEVSSLLAGREIGGVRLPALLALVAAPGARSIIAESSDGSFRTTLTLGAAQHCVVVYRVGNASLPVGLGGPFRLITQGRLHCGDIKQLGSIYVSERRFIDSPESERIAIRSHRAA